MLLSLLTLAACVHTQEAATSTPLPEGSNNELVQLIETDPQAFVKKVNAERHSPEVGSAMGRYDRERIAAACGAYSPGTPKFNLDQCGLISACASFLRNDAMDACQCHLCLTADLPKDVDLWGCQGLAATENITTACD